MFTGLKLVGKSLVAFIIWLWLNTIVWAWRKIDFHRLSIEMYSYNISVSVYAHNETYTIQHRFNHNHIIGLRWTTHEHQREYEFEMWAYRYWSNWLPFEFRTGFNKSWRCKECGSMRDFPIAVHNTCRRCLDKMAAKAEAELKEKEAAAIRGEAVPEYVETVW